MSTAPQTADARRAFRVGVDLPMLASQAAAELDDLSRSRSTTGVATAELAALLKNSIRSIPGPVVRRGISDPAAEAVLGRAMGLASDTQTGKRVEDLVSEAEQMADRLLRAQTENTADFARLRGFCVALANAATAYLRADEELRPTHPFRR